MKHKSNPNLLPTTPNTDPPTATEVRDSREDQFVEYLFTGLSVEQAGIRAGYSPGYSKGPIYKKFKQIPFQDKVREHFRSSAYTDLSLIRRINSQSLELMVKAAEIGDVDTLSKLKHIPRPIMELTKLLTPDAGGTVNFINIESLQAVIGSKMVKGGED